MYVFNLKFCSQNISVQCIYDVCIQYSGGKYIAADEYGVPPAGSIYMNAGEPGLLSPYPGGQAYPVCILCILQKFRKMPQI